MESKRYHFRKICAVPNGLSLTDPPAWWSAAKTLQPVSCRTLGTRALQVALVVVVPGGSIVLPLLWLFDQRSDLKSMLGRWFRYTPRLDIDVPRIVDRL